MRQFVFNAMLAENSLMQLASEGIAIRGAATPPVIAIDQLGFSPRIMYEATKMASVFTAFFCMENSARELITERMLLRRGVDWWDTHVPLRIRTAAQKLKDKEAANKYHAARSSDLIGYTLFGHLGDIITNNWDAFEDLFPPEQYWISSRFKDLEMSRNIIMHTGTLPQIEVERVQSILRDWIAQVG